MGFKGGRGWAGAIQGILQGGLEGYKTGRALQDMAAERALKKKQFDLDVEKSSAGQTIVGADGKIYQTSGISTEAKSRLLDGKSVPSPILPGATNLGTGKISLQKPPKVEEPVTNVSVSEFNTNPELFRDKKIKVVPDVKAPGLSLDQRANLELLKGAYKNYIDTGKVPEHLKAPMSEAMKKLDINLIPEEDQGIVYSIQQLFGGDKQFTLESAGKVAPKPAAKVPAPKAEAKIIKVKLIGTNQTGSIPENEFDPAVYEKIGG